MGTVMRSFNQNPKGTELGLEDQTIEEKADGAQRCRAEPGAIDESCNVQEAGKQGRQGTRAPGSAFGAPETWNQWLRDDRIPGAGHRPTARGDDKRMAQIGRRLR